MVDARRGRGSISDHRHAQAQTRPALRWARAAVVHERGTRLEELRWPLRRGIRGRAETRRGDGPHRGAGGITKRSRVGVASASRLGQGPGSLAADGRGEAAWQRPGPYERSRMRNEDITLCEFTLY